jgi:AAA domain
MSSTRYAEEGAPMSDEKYMSAVEFAQNRPVNPVATAERVALLRSPEEKSLIWFLQGLSCLKEGIFPRKGGLMEVANRLIQKDEGLVFARERREYARSQRQSDQSHDQARIARLLLKHRGEYVREWADKPSKEKKEFSRTVAESDRLGAAWSLCEFLRQLCVDPNLSLEPTKEEWPGVLAALRDYRLEHERSAGERFKLTTNGREIWKCIKKNFTRRGIVLVKGGEGLGKSVAAEGCCECHLDQVRFVTLDGISNCTMVFGRISQALGLNHSKNRKTTEMQASIQRVLERSSLSLVVDEGHYLFGRHRRIDTVPELVDWITTLNNRSTPICLITTREIDGAITRATVEVGWHWKEFRRRVSSFIELGPTPIGEIESTARAIVPYAGERMIKTILGYVANSGRDMSALGDVFRDAMTAAVTAGRDRITAEDLQAAIVELMRTDAHFLKIEERIKSFKKRSRKAVETIQPEQAPREISAANGRNVFPAAARSELPPTLDPIKL